MCIPENIVCDIIGWKNLKKDSGDTEHTLTNQSKPDSEQHTHLAYNRVLSLYMLHKMLTGMEGFVVAISTSKLLPILILSAVNQLVFFQVMHP